MTAEPIPPQDGMQNPRSVFSVCLLHRFDVVCEPREYIPAMGPFEESHRESESVVEGQHPDLMRYPRHRGIEPSAQYRDQHQIQEEEQSREDDRLQQ